jgi:hypothetical protein
MDYKNLPQKAHRPPQGWSITPKGTATLTSQRIRDLSTANGRSGRASSEPSPRSWRSMFANVALLPSDKKNVAQP